jgi:hypothetical protein
VVNFRKFIQKLFLKRQRQIERSAKENNIANPVLVGEGFVALKYLGLFNIML